MALLWLLAAATPGLADVEFGMSSEPYFVGSPITLAIDVINASEHEPPRLPPIEGAEVVGPTSSSSRQISIVNGRQSTTESVSYRFEIIPRRAGPLEIPSIELKVNGEPKRTSPRVVQVTKSDAEDLLFVEVHADRPTVYLGEPLQLKLELWLRRYVKRDANFGSENDMWQCVDVRRSNWGPFASLLQEVKNITVSKEYRRDQAGVNREYFVYRLQLTHWPDQAGPLTLGDISIRVEYPLQVDRDRSVFSMFNEPRVLRSRPISASAEVDPIAVKSVPTAGQPPGYNGAVGRYTFAVEAKPTEVHVGDPITLTMTVKGQGRLELLQPPKLEEVEDLVKEFKLPSDLLAGVVEGGAKRFTQTLRARDASVTRIPALPFSYFDTQAEKFVTVRSDPIPIQVSASERLAVSNAVEAETGQRIATRLTRRDDGILANYNDLDLLLSAHVFAPGSGTALCVAAPPAFYLGSLLVRRRREKLRRDVGYARRQKAHASAQRALDQAKAVTDNGQRAAHVLAALTGFVADRRGLPPGALTRGETLQHLRDGGAGTESLRLVDELLAECEAVRYAGSTTAAGTALIERARACIQGLERERQ